MYHVKHITLRKYVSCENTLALGIYVLYANTLALRIYVTP